MWGTIRSYNDSALATIKEKIRNIVNNTAATFDCKAEILLDDMYPATVCSATEADHVRRIAEKHFGTDKVSAKDLPMTCSEDFSYFLQERPGCMFALGTR